MKLAIRTVWALAALMVAMAVLAAILGWLAPLEAVLSAVLALMFLALVRLEVFRQEQARMAKGLEQSMLTLAAGLDALRTRLGDKDPTAEMVREMRVLQTLLSRIVAHRDLPAPAQAQDEADGEPNPSGQEAPSAAMSVREAVREALAENRVDLYLQPIVHLPSRRTAHFECFSRVRDASGRIIFPGDYLDVAEEEGMIGTLDNLLLFRCIQLIRKLGHRQPGLRFFVNISPHALADAEFFGQFVDFMVGNPELSSRLVFEFPALSFVSLGEDRLSMLMRLATAGYVFSLDRTEGDLPDLGWAGRHHVRFIKIDAAQLLKEGAGLPRILAAARSHEITLIATHIEAELPMPDLIDLDIGLAQGYLFDRPRPASERAGDL
ncbi:MAG: hypothetical protein Tsb008_20640 [Rhodothalassiaceae bacterium]